MAESVASSDQSSTQENHRKNDCDLARIPCSSHSRGVCSKNKGMFVVALVNNSPVFRWDLNTVMASDLEHRPLRV